MTRTTAEIEAAIAVAVRIGWLRQVIKGGEARHELTPLGRRHVEEHEGRGARPCDCVPLGVAC